MDYVCDFLYVLDIIIRMHEGEFWLTSTLERTQKWVHFSLKSAQMFV